jgi:hypothetical protein
MITMHANQEAVTGTNNGSVEEFVNQLEVARLVSEDPCCLET